MSHSEFLHSLHSNDGRRWRFEERNGQSFYIDITDEEKNPYRSNKPGPTLIRDRKARAQMRKKVRPHEKAYAWRLGYNICSGQYTGGEDVPMLSGSSLNRKIAKPKPAAKKSEELPIHVMSKRTKGKIRDKATAFFRAVPQRIFVTLTFFQYVEDREAKVILNKFLTMVRREVKGFEYLVVSEHHPLRADHCIHFHMLSSRRLNIQRYNALWTIQQYNSGLRGHRANGEKIPMNEIAQRYNDGTIGEVLNPVQVEKAYSISGLASYLTKYVSKQETGEKFGCLTWHCSRKVSRLFTSQLVGPSAFAYLQSFRNYKLDRKTGEMWAPQQIKGPFFTLIFVNNKPAVLQNLKMLETVNNWIIEKFIPDRNFGITTEQYRRVFIGKELKFDPSGVVQGILSRKKFLSQQQPNEYVQ
jgi:hypothetical protein